MEAAIETPGEGGEIRPAWINNFQVSKARVSAKGAVPIARVSGNMAGSTIMLATCFSRFTSCSSVSPIQGHSVTFEDLLLELFAEQTGALLFNQFG